MTKTTSLDTSRRLKEAGFKPDTNFTWVESIKHGYILETFNTQFHGAVHNYHCAGFNNIDHPMFPAPTTDELIEELPARLSLEDADYWFHISPLDQNSAYDCRYKGWVGNPQWQKTLKWFQDPLVCDSLASMWLWLKKEGLI